MELDKVSEQVCFFWLRQFVHVCVCLFALFVCYFSFVLLSSHVLFCHCCLVSPPPLPQKHKHNGSYLIVKRF